MSDKTLPEMFRFLPFDRSIADSDVVGTSDGFFLVNKSIATILSSKKCEGTVPSYKDDSKLVKRQNPLHKGFPKYR